MTEEEKRLFLRMAQDIKDLKQLIEDVHALVFTHKHNSMGRTTAGGF